MAALEAGFPLTGTDPDNSNRYFVDITGQVTVSIEQDSNEPAVLRVQLNISGVKVPPNDPLSPQSFIGWARIGFTQEASSRGSIAISQGQLQSAFIQSDPNQLSDALIDIVVPLPDCSIDIV